MSLKSNNTLYGEAWGGAVSKMIAEWFAWLGASLRCELIARWGRPKPVLTIDRELQFVMQNQGSKGKGNRFQTLAG